MRIGELAGLVGLSARAIRHCHHIGLLPEPARRANGYREYALRDAVELARVRRLTELGLNLGEVADALCRDAGRDLAEILRELDADLGRQEADLRQRRGRLAQLLRQAEAGGGSDQAPVSAELAELFGRMAAHAAARPGREPAVAAQDRGVMALLETASAGGAGWLDVLTRALNSDPGAVERAYAVYGRLDELARSRADDPGVEAAARAIVAAIPEPARQAIRFPAGGLEEADESFAAAFYAGFAPAQAAAIRRAVDLMSRP
jgi:DNA-binding transcriptional MerR regulator